MSNSDGLYVFVDRILSIIRHDYEYAQGNESASAIENLRYPSMHYETDFFSTLESKGRYDLQCPHLQSLGPTLLSYLLILIKIMSKDRWIRYYLSQEARVNQNGLVNRVSFSL